MKYDNELMGGAQREADRASIAEIAQSDPKGPVYVIGVRMEGRPRPLLSATAPTCSRRHPRADGAPLPDAVFGRSSSTIAVGSRRSSPPLQFIRTVRAKDLDPSFDPPPDYSGIAAARRLRARHQADSRRRSRRGRRPASSARRAALRRARHARPSLTPAGLVVASIEVVC